MGRKEQELQPTYQEKKTRESLKVLLFADDKHLSAAIFSPLFGNESADLRGGEGEGEGCGH